jgi:predicted RNA binding protein YcfA (HicA-like mRNA interferase family)
MSGHYPPLTCAQFKNVLTKMGFAFREQKGSHEQWVGHVGGQFRKVTVDCPKAPFSQELIRSMAKQAGVTKKTVYDFHFGRKNCL